MYWEDVASSYNTRTFKVTYTVDSNADRGNQDIKVGVYADNLLVTEGLVVVSG